MKWLGYTVAFVAGAVVGGLIVRELAIAKIENPINALIDGVFPPGTYWNGETKTQVDAFVRN